MLWGERKQGAMVVQADNERAPPRGFNIGPLALVWPFIRRLNVAEIVNAHCPADPQAEFAYGDVVEAMVACRLYNPVALYRVEDWAREEGAEHFLGIPAEKLNDDRLGRTLEAIFPHRYSIMAHIAFRAACEFGVPLGVLHYDPTHFLFYGEYENQHEAVDLLNVRRGRHSRGSPSVKEAQVGVDVANDGLGSVPVFFHTGSGNEQHKVLAVRNLEKIQEHLRPKRLLLIEDRGSFSRLHGFRIDKDGFHFIAAQPWSQGRQGVAGTIPEDDFTPSRFLSIAEARKRQAGKPASTWESYRVAERSRIWKHPDRKNPAEMAVRIVFVRSSADAKAARKARRTYTEKIRQGLLAIQASVAKGCRNTDQNSVARRVAKVMGRKSAAKYFCWDMAVLSESERQALGKPAPGRRLPTHRFEFTYDPSAAEADARWDGYWALATNLPTTEIHAVVETADRVVGDPAVVRRPSDRVRNHRNAPGVGDRGAAGAQNEVVADCAVAQIPQGQVDAVVPPIDRNLVAPGRARPADDDAADLTVALDGLSLIDHPHGAGGIRRHRSARASRCRRGRRSDGHRTGAPADAGARGQAHGGGARRCE